MPSLVKRTKQINTLNDHGANDSNLDAQKSKTIKNLKKK